MDSFNPLADVMRASIGSLARNLSRTETEKEAESAAVVMIVSQAAEQIITQRQRLREEHTDEQKSRIAAGLIVGSPEWDTLIASQSKAMESFDRLLARLG